MTPYLTKQFIVLSTAGKDSLSGVRDTFLLLRQSHLT